MTLDRVRQILAYSNEKPVEIKTDAQWRAMVKQVPNAVQAQEDRAAIRRERYGY